MNKQESRILELEHTIEVLREMFDEVLYDDQARAEYRRIDEQYKNERD